MVWVENFEISALPSQGVRSASELHPDKNGGDADTFADRRCCHRYSFSVLGPPEYFQRSSVLCNIAPMKMAAPPLLMVHDSIFIRRAAFHLCILSRSRSCRRSRLQWAGIKRSRDAMKLVVVPGSHQYLSGSPRHIVTCSMTTAPFEATFG